MKQEAREKKSNMATQKEVLEKVCSCGFYEARLYEMEQSVRGIRDVDPALLLVEKGILQLEKMQVESSEQANCKVTLYRFKAL